MRGVTLLLVWASLSILACSSSDSGGGGGASNGDGASTGAGAGTTSTSTSTSTGTSTSTSASASASTGTSGGACGSPGPEYTSDDGSVTFYTFAMGSTAVNCSFPITGTDPDVVGHVATGDGQYFGALNTADYANSATCGACIEVTRDGTRKVVITVVDQCPTDSNPKCTPGHIDLSKNAFLQIGEEQEGYLGTGNGASVGAISWRYVACPTTADVTYTLKEPTNQYWNQILVEDHAYAIDKLEANVDGQWVSADRQSYNYWQVGDGSLGDAPYQARVTDVNGDVVTASLALAAGDQASSAQFPVCQ
jgi:expansin (peptidoglycan-binding protein)